MDNSQDSGVSMHLQSNLKIVAGHSCLQGDKSSNDDCLGVRVPKEPELTTKGVVAVIADGVSVAEKGKEAAEICVQGFLNDYYDTPDAWTVKTASQKVLTSLNRWLYNLGQGYVNPNQGFVTTLSILVIKGNTAHIFHVGDSRICRLRDGRFEQLTHDHCARLSENHRQLTRAMGLDVKLDVDYRRENVRKGDLYCLSTDGMHEFVSIGQQKKLLVESNDLDETAASLNESAIEGGSNDNLTTLLVEVNELSEINEKEVYRFVSSLPYPPELSPGMVLDGYEVLRELKSSSRSQVYLVKDKELDEIFVMKTPSVNYEDDTAYLERFAMESWIGKRIDSVHVAKSIRVPRRQRFLYNIFEYVEGPTLKRWIEENPKAEVKEVRRIVEQLVKGLRAMHRREMLHQDLKPENIVIHPERGAMIIDMGSSFVGGIDEINVGFQRDDILGTASYSAPEYRLGRKPTNKADMFSLGMIIYQMFTGKLPYNEAFSNAQTVRDFSVLKYEPAYVHNPLIPVWVDGVIQKMVQVNADLRYESFSELLYDLEHPNKNFLLQENLPFLQKQSLGFWKTATLVLFLTQIATLLFILLD